MVPTVAFVLGFSLMFTAYGASAGLVGYSLTRNQDVLNLVAGSLLIATGIAMVAFPRIGLMQTDRRLATARRPTTLVGAGLVGAAFAVGWTPCIGPILGSILTYAAPTGSPGIGATLLFTYSLGLGIPFLLSGLFVTRTMAAFRWLRDRWRIVNAAAAAVFIVIGFLVATGTLRGHHPAALRRRVPGHLRIVSIVGNRPQFVKAAPLSRALRRRVDEVLVHSGQHYDPELADLFFDELGVPQPDHALEVGSGSPLAQTAVMLQRLEPLLVAEAPDMVLVYGDTTTTLAGALAAAKLGVPLGHVEAGLRSFDRTMPEEQNRVVADHLSPLLLCPTETAVENLAREGITAGVHQVGDVMLDASRMFAPAAAARPGPAALGLAPGAYLLVTVHRAAATDTPEALAALVAVLEAIDEPAVFPVHPRTRHRLEEAGMWERLSAHPSLRLSPPVGYLDFTALLMGARAVVTDSGGVQKEAYFHGIPCVTLRDTTEWVETVGGGFNRLVGMDPTRLRAALADLSMPEERRPYYGDGDAAGRIADAVAPAHAG